MARPRKAFALTITPATPANRWALAARLEADFAALPPPVANDTIFREPVRELCEKVRCSPHKELIPLALRLIDRYPMRDPDADHDFVARKELAATIFMADPAAAHGIFVDRLLASPPRIDPEIVFPMWEMSEQFVWRLFAGINPNIRFILPDAELKQLAMAKDPRVQKLVEETFGERLKRR